MAFLPPRRSRPWLTPEVSPFFQPMKFLKPSNQIIVPCAYVLSMRKTSNRAGCSPAEPTKLTEPWGFDRSGFVIFFDLPCWESVSFSWKLAFPSLFDPPGCALCFDVKSSADCRKRTCSGQEPTWNTRGQREGRTTYLYLLRIKREWPSEGSMQPRWSRNGCYISSSPSSIINEQLRDTLRTIYFRHTGIQRWQVTYKSPRYDIIWRSLGTQYSLWQSLNGVCTRLRIYVMQRSLQIRVLCPPGRPLTSIPRKTNRACRNFWNQPVWVDEYPAII